MAKVVIVSGLQITDNPRAVKEADALAEAGFDVEVLASIYSDEAFVEIARLLEGRSWQHTPIADFRGADFGARLRGLAARARTRVAKSLKRGFALELPDQLGPVTRPLCAAALSRDAGLYVVHLEQALWAGVQLLKAGRAVAIDIEDWYSEDGLPEDRALRPTGLIRRCERALLAQAAYATTTSHALADALARAYAVAPPGVIYNSFPLEERSSVDGKTRDRTGQNRPSIVWFSQTIGPGRGLEDLIAAASGIGEDFELHIRGVPRPGFAGTLAAGASPRLRERLYFHPRVPQAELLSRLCEHDIGYCGEIANCPSRDLTITNKLFEYMRSGLAIVASDTQGQKEAAEHARDAIRLFRQNDIGALRVELRALIADRAALAAAKASSLENFKARFDWAESKRKLQKLAEDYFSGRSPRPAAT